MQACGVVELHSRIDWKRDERLGEAPADPSSCWRPSGLQIMCKCYIFLAIVCQTFGWTVSLLSFCLPYVGQFWWSWQSISSNFWNCLHLILSNLANLKDWLKLTNIWQALVKFGKFRSADCRTRLSKRCAEKKKRKRKKGETYCTVKVYSFIRFLEFWERCKSAYML